MLGPEWHEEKVARHLMAANLVPYGVSFLDDALLGILPNELILVGAKTGRGKTELATSIALNASSAGKQVAFFALEADQWEIQRRLKYRKIAQFFHQHYAGQPFPRYREWLLQGLTNGGLLPEWEEMERYAERSLDIETSTLDVIYTGDHYTPYQFCQQMAAMKDHDLIIVDHLHYFDLMGDQETEGLKKAIHSIRNAALVHGKAVVLIAHLRKGERSSKMVLPTIDDFHGHSDIAKVCTTAILMAPANADHHKTLGIYPTYFHIAKCRTAADVTPFVGVMGFDFKMNCYSERYYLEEASFFEDPKTIDSVDQIPKWAKRALRPTGQFIRGGPAAYRTSD